MLKRLLFSLVVTLAFAAHGMFGTARAEEPIPWAGTVTAVDSNGNRPGRSFTAVDANGQVKMFYISSLDYLKIGSRVELRYEPGTSYPLVVTRIRFLPPTE